MYRWFVAPISHRSILKCRRSSWQDLALELPKRLPGHTRSKFRPVMKLNPTPGLVDHNRHIRIVRASLLQRELPVE